MKLRGLIIADFKAFGDHQEIPIRPITLIYGANSSGKSSIIHALALAHEAIRTKNLDVHETEIGGESIDLGGFRQYVHRRDADRFALLGFEFSPPISGNNPKSLDSAKDVTLFASIGADPHSFDRYEETSSFQNSPSFVHIKDFKIFVDNESVCDVKRTSEISFKIENLNYNHKIIREMLNKILSNDKINTKSQRNLKSAGKIIGDVILEHLPVYESGIFPYIPPSQMPTINENLRESGIPHWALPKNQIPPIKGPKKLVSAVYRGFPDALGTFMNDTVRDATKAINKLQYLGPLRSYPPRRFVSAKHRNANWYAGGGHAWDVICRNDEVRERINEWLAPDRLGTPYKLVNRSLIELEELEHIIAEVIKEVAGDEENVREFGWSELLTDIDRNVKKRVLQRIGEYTKDRFNDPVLVDLRTNTEVSHRDVGIGISQVLPVLVSAYASQDRLLAIEQPEIHLHPALQAELGDVFIESALGKDTGNTLLLETHSEHLLLRIMRRMRETCDGTLPEGIPEVRPEDVMVLFVEPRESGSVVREIELTKRGELASAWPGGFFEEGLREVF